MKVLVAGELNADLIFSGLSAQPRPGSEVLAGDFSLALGSSSAICAAGLARLGTPVSFLGLIGPDVWGRFCLDELTRAGVDVSLVQEEDRYQTGVTGSFSSADDRALVTFPGAITQLTAAHIPAAVLKNFNHLHVSSYFLQTGLQAGLPELFRTAKDLDLTVSLDPGHDPDEHWQSLTPTLAYCDVLFLNEVELAGLAETSSVADGLTALSAVTNGQTLVVAKLGKRGCAAVWKGQTRFADAIEVDVVDTTGAGDSFNAGFLHVWLQGFPLESCLASGSICGGLSTRKPGGCGAQASWPEVERIMQDIGKHPVAIGGHGRY